MTAASEPDTRPILAVSPMTMHVRNRVRIPNIHCQARPGCLLDNHFPTVGTIAPFLAMSVRSPPVQAGFLTAAP